MTASTSNTQPVIIIGAGFTGLCAAYELSLRGVAVTVLEADDCVGGLAGSFSTPGQDLEKFYHHWFTSDEHVNGIVADLGETDRIVHRATVTGSYYANRIFRLSSPLDVLRYTPLSLLNRIRLGLLVLQARWVKDWRKLESVTAMDWIESLAGSEVLNKVWRPLMIGKFGEFADRISAVWFWNKLVLRGGSRGARGKEVLAYYEGGFAALAQRMAQQIETQGGSIQLNSPVTALNIDGEQIHGVYVGDDYLPASRVLMTTALPIVAELMQPHVSADYITRLNSIDYLGNSCLVLELDRSLSETYWLNVNDPGFPYVGIIEHTNFEPPEHYAGRHIVYLSKYLPISADLYTMNAEQIFEYSIPHIQNMFPDFDREWVLDYHVFKARYSQPIVGKHYSQLIPDEDTPVSKLHLTSMAQIYPEDRGTNYAIREGRRVGRRLVELAQKP